MSNKKYSAITPSLKINEYKVLEEKLVKRITKELFNANRNNDIGDYLKSIGCEDLIVPYNTVYSSNAKIIVIGRSYIKPDIMRAIAKSNGIDPNRLEIYNDYDKLTNFNINFLRNNMNYCDIIFGPAPHSMEYIGSYTSALAMIKQNSAEFPKLNVANDSNKLKITKNSFERCLLNTQYYLKEVKEYN